MPMAFSLTDRWLCWRSAQPLCRVSVAANANCEMSLSICARGWAGEDKHERGAGERTAYVTLQRAKSDRKGKGKRRQRAEKKMHTEIQYTCKRQ